MDKELYALKDINAKKLDNICKEFEEDMFNIWIAITEAVVHGPSREVTVWNLKQRGLALKKMKSLGYTCTCEFGNGTGSRFKDGLNIKWEDKPDDV